MSEHTNVQTGHILNNKWRVLSLLGGGACAKVYTVESVTPLPSDESYPMVVKVISTGKGLKKKEAKEQMDMSNTLNYEYELIVGHLEGLPYRPRVPSKFYGTDEAVGCRYLVMERLDCDLLAWAKTQPTVSAIASIGLKILDGLQWLHQRRILCIDIKPDNFMLKVGQLYFVDYGIVELATSNRNAGRGVVGTPSYASLAVHNGALNMWKDDIESMALVLLSLTDVNCSLPWSKAASPDALKSMINECNILDLTKSRNCPDLGHIIVYLRTLRSSDKVDYALVQKHLNTMKSSKALTASASNCAVVASTAASKCGKKDSISAAGHAAAAVSSPKKVKGRKAEALTVEQVIEVAEVASASKGRVKAKEETIISSSAAAAAAAAISPNKRVRHSARQQRLSDANGTSSIQYLYFTIENGDTFYAGDNKETCVFNRKIVGSSKDVDYVISSDSSIRDQHLLIFYSWDINGTLECNVQDMQGTSGGTRINGSIAESKKWIQVFDKDVLLVGNSKITVQVVDKMKK